MAHFGDPEIVMRRHRTNSCITSLIFHQLSYFLCLNIPEKSEEFIWRVISSIRKLLGMIWAKMHQNESEKNGLGSRKQQKLQYSTNNLIKTTRHWKEESLSFPTVPSTHMGIFIFDFGLSDNVCIGFPVFTLFQRSKVAPAWPNITYAVVPTGD